MIQPRRPPLDPVRVGPVRVGPTANLPTPRPHSAAVRLGGGYYGYGGYAGFGDTTVMVRRRAVTGAGQGTGGKSTGAGCANDTPSAVASVGDGLPTRMAPEQDLARQPS